MFLEEMKDTKWINAWTTNFTTATTINFKYL